MTPAEHIALARAESHGRIHAIAIDATSELLRLHPDSSFAKYLRERLSDIEAQQAAAESAYRAAWPTPEALAHHAKEAA